VSRIKTRFDQVSRLGRKAFIPYVTAGDPDLETTARLIVEMDRVGADIIELGVPFSDPMADGPVIQRASERALRNGVGVRDCLDMLSEVRRNCEVSVVLFTYLNPLLALGVERIGSELHHAGVDGLLVTDLVPEEAGELIPDLRKAGIDTVFLVAPTSTDERIARVAAASKGFIYAVSRTGVTGIRKTLADGVADLVRRVRRLSNLPVAVGFGISNHEHVLEAWEFADAAVVGSRIVAEIEARSGDSDLVARVGELCRNLMYGAEQTAGG
jgi:tryptophan synthase alpha chain